MDKNQVINEVKTYLANQGDKYRYDITYNTDSIVIKKNNERSFTAACILWYMKNNKFIREVCGAEFETIGDYTFCALTLENETRFGVAKRYKDDDYNPIIGRVAAFAHATRQDLEHMIGLK